MSKDLDQKDKVALIVPALHKYPVWFIKTLELFEVKGHKCIVIQRSMKRSSSFVEKVLKIIMILWQVKESPHFTKKKLPKSVRIQFNKIDLDPQSIIIDLAGAYQWIKEQNAPNPYYSLDNLAWHSTDFDSSCRAWFAQKSGSLIRLFKHQKKDLIPINYVLSVSGQLSLNIYRNVYAPLPYLICSALRNTFCCHPPPMPEAIESNGNLFTAVLIAVLRKVRSKIKSPKWKVVYKQEGGKWTSISTPGLIELADPFFLIKNGKTHVFAEEIDETGRGKIVTFRIDKPDQRTPILGQSYHMSYPFLFEYENKIFLLPESSENGTLTMYQATNFPFEWTKVYDVFNDKEVVDSTLIYWNNKWWLFANTKDYAATFNEELSIFYANDLFGPWNAHKQNPIMIDARFSRQAGAFIIVDGKLCRYVQDCSWTYGEKIHMMEIKELMTVSFKEVYRETVDLSLQEGFLANHTLNSSIDPAFVIADIYK